MKIIKQNMLIGQNVLGKQKWINVSLNLKSAEKKSYPPPPPPRRLSCAAPQSETHMHTPLIHLHFSRPNSWFRRHLLSPAALTRLLRADSGQPSPETKSRLAEADLLRWQTHPLRRARSSAQIMSAGNKYHSKKIQLARVSTGLLCLYYKRGLQIASTLTHDSWMFPALWAPHHHLLQWWKDTLIITVQS